MSSRRHQLMAGERPVTRIERMSGGSNVLGTKQGKMTMKSRILEIQRFSSNGNEMGSGLPALLRHALAMICLCCLFTGIADAQVTSTTITVTWSAPGDDSLTGVASAYDIRYSQSPINAANWAGASQVAGEPTPKPAGGNENFTISGLSPGQTYYIAIKSVDEAGNWSAISNIVSATTSILLDADDGTGTLPIEFRLRQNFPNPFNPVTAIDFSIPKAGVVELAVFNILGERVTTLASGQFAAGDHQVIWNGCDASGTEVASGVYLYRLETDSHSAVRKMVLMR